DAEIAFQPLDTDARISSRVSFQSLLYQRVRTPSIGHAQFPVGIGLLLDGADHVNKKRNRRLVSRHDDADERARAEGHSALLLEPPRPWFVLLDPGRVLLVRRESGCRRHFGVTRYRLPCHRTGRWPKLLVNVADGTLANLHSPVAIPDTGGPIGQSSQAV